MPRADHETGTLISRIVAPVAAWNGVRRRAASHLMYLDAQRQYLQATLERTKSQADRYADTAALFQALGGGWWNAASADGTLAAQTKR